MGAIAQRSQVEALNDATQLAFHGEYFSRAQEGPSEREYGTVLATSGRLKRTYDPNAKSMAEISEFHALLHDSTKGITYPGHFVIVQWDTGERYGVELHSGNVLQTQGSDAPVDTISTNIIRALGAATSIV